MFKIKNLVVLSAFVASALVLLSFIKGDPKTSRQQTKKPLNIVLIIVDQYRADASKREGFALNTTPFLDSLAQTGTWFNKAYCAAPICAPSRISMFTGRFPSATHTRSNFNIQDAFYSKDLVDVLKANNYNTALIGKNHTYLTPKMFDYWRNVDHLGEPQVTDPKLKEVNEFLKDTHFYMSAKAAPFPAELQQPSRILKYGTEWISKLKADGNDKPFFLYMSIPEPHNPYQVSEPYYSMFPPNTLPPFKTGKASLPTKGNKWQLHQQLLTMGYGDYESQIPRIRSNYYGMMRLIDDQMRNFVNYLKKNDLYDNTLLVFVADHGDFTGEYGLIKKGIEVPDCLTRIPMIWHGPGIVQSKLPHTAHVSNVDIMPTLCGMIGTPIPDGVQGRSLWPMLTGKPYPKQEFASMMVQQGYGGLHYVNFEEYDPYTQDGTVTKGQTEADELNTWSQSGSMRMLRKDDYKLVYDMQGAGQLYNVKADPAEVNNLYGNEKYAKKQMELLQDLMTWDLRAQDPLPLPRRGGKRQYGFKRDPNNYWTPYVNEPAENVKKKK
ncbi:MAG: sulfatase-like hydrolase/transferase [Bacteroidota bacterium]